MKKDKGAQAPKSAAERQAAYRARKADAGKTEVRGIFATFDDAKKIKAFADSIKFENGAK